MPKFQACFQSVFASLNMTTNEPQAVAQRYAKRSQTQRYSLLNPDVWQTVQERQRAMLRLFFQLGYLELEPLRVLEVGCGNGSNLLELLRLGFVSQNLSGIDLLPERAEVARAQLPAATVIHQGDALQCQVAANSQDIVLVFTVFSSLLDDDFQQQLAQTMWRWVKPGGGVLWYDFAVNNPRNSDVRGVRIERIKALFPQGHLQTQRITLAPPIARRVSAIAPSLYTVFNSVPWLRTHVLAWIGKT
jgi:ubiquinone/menaquinone biosynthesis C-methylase UbiE